MSGFVDGFVSRLLYGMVIKPTFTIRAVSWAEAEVQLRRVREQVFMREQGVPAKLEWDEFDGDAVHWLGEDAAGNLIATARLLPDGHIGRMAVVKSWRRQGVGSALLQAILRLAQDRNYPRLALNAQLHAVAFYEKFGFRQMGPEFIDAGIPHIRMIMIGDSFAGIGR